MRKILITVLILEAFVFNGVFIHNYAYKKAARETLNYIYSEEPILIGKAVRNITFRNTGL